jgi:formylglycine-generating enzyme required for sulfatase activity
LESLTAESESKTAPKLPDWADGWRVSGVIRMGGKTEAIPLAEAVDWTDARTKRVAVAGQAAVPAASVAAASAVGRSGTGAAWENSLGMKFLPVPGTKAQFCVWETRNRDFRAFKADHDSGKFENHSLNGDEQPVVDVSWDDAKAFCDWLTRTERQKGLIGPAQSYRLPMEWEWSVAVGLNEAKGGTSKDKGEKNAADYPWGREWPPPKGAGNYSGSESAWSSARMKCYRDNHAVTAPVGSYSPNRLGLFDLGGNVWEYCEDYYDASQQFRVVRGGSWGTTGPGDYLLSSSRGRGRLGERGSFGGFRVVLSPSSP